MPRGTIEIKMSRMELVSSVAFIGINLYTKNIPGALRSASNILRNISQKTSREELLKVLIILSLNKAMTNVVMDLADRLGEEKLEVLKDFTRENIFSLYSSDEIVDGDGIVVFSVIENFFKRPEEIIEDNAIASICKRQLMELGFSEKEVAQIFARLKAQFIFALRDVWLINYQKFNGILFPETPFDNKVKLQSSWDRYQAYLQTLPEERVFVETFGLEDIYIPLYAVCEEEKKGSVCESENSFFPLHEHVKTWIAKEENDGEKQILFIKGDPGCGKSSFAKMLAKELIEEGKQVVYVPLQNLQIEQQLFKGIAMYLEEERHFEEGLLRRVDSFDGCVLILDGLDEYSEAGKHGISLAGKFFDHVSDALGRRGLVKVILTGRTFAVSEIEHRLESKNSCLRMLPYQASKDDGDQRREWWEKYYDLIDENSAGLPDFMFQHKEPKHLLIEITRQPLLNYLLALGFETGLVFSAETNVNKIYSHLISSFFARDAEKNFPRVGKFFTRGKFLEKIGLKEREFFFLLQMIALSAWHEGEVRKTSWKNVNSFCKGNLGSEEACNALSKFEAGNGSSKLLWTFYFVPIEGRGEESVFEFTHKSFGEYLAVRGILYHANRFFEGYNGKHLNLPDCMGKWVQLCGPAPLTYDLLGFLRREIVLCHNNDPGKVEKWQDFLVEMCSFLQQEGEIFPEGIRLSFKQKEEYARNAGETLLVMLSACAFVNKKISHINWPDRFSLANWLYKLRRQGGEEIFCYCLNFLDAEKQDLSSQRLDNFVFFNSYLNDTNLYNTDFSFANLSKAKLSNANLSGADFSYANFTDVNLSGADLNGANLGCANLTNANLSGADLNDANLNIADLSGANLKGANLDTASLGIAKLTNADLSGADLSDADLCGADLSGTNLSGTDLSRANFTGTDLSGAVGLSKMMLEVTFGNSETRLPPDVSGPEYWKEDSPF